MNRLLWRSKLNWVMCLMLALLLSGRASTPIVDQVGIDLEAYTNELKMSALRGSG